MTHISIFISAVCPLHVMNFSFLFFFRTSRWLVWDWKFIIRQIDCLRSTIKLLKNQHAADSRPSPLFFPPPNLRDSMFMHHLAFFMGWHLRYPQGYVTHARVSVFVQLCCYARNEQLVKASFDNAWKDHFLVFISFLCNSKENVLKNYHLINWWNLETM